MRVISGPVHHRRVNTDDPTTELVASRASVDLPLVELVVIDGADRGNLVRCAESVIRIGTGPSSDLRLTDKTVSRLHAEVLVEPSGIKLRDCGSTNGTYVDEVPVRDADLRDGATIRLGATTLGVELRGESLHLPLSEKESFGGVIGRSVAMRRVYAVMEKISPTDATVLIQGETGTGKELIARALHDHSMRSAGPFIPIDCGAFAEHLIESELFGHVRGAFTGAISDRKGVFEEADGGTLFFDEIGELPLGLQRKLLRVLETREVRKLGTNVAKGVNVRIVAATNRPLARSVNAGWFREDLYYRLAVVSIDLPPLRARRDDVPLLAMHFLERFTGKPQSIPPSLLAALLTRGWPGNVRELRNFIERSLSLGWPGEQRDPSPPHRVRVPAGAQRANPVSFASKRSAPRVD